MKKMVLVLLLLALAFSAVLGCGVKDPDGRYLNPGDQKRGHALGEPIPLEEPVELG